MSVEHTTAFVPSQEKYVVKKHGSLPSVTLQSGTSGDNPSKAAASSMYFWKVSLMKLNKSEQNTNRTRKREAFYLTNFKSLLLFHRIHRLTNPNKYFCMSVEYQYVLSQQIILREVVNFGNLQGLLRGDSIKIL